MRPAEEGLLLLCCALGQTDVHPLTPSQYSALAERVARMDGRADSEVTAELLRAIGCENSEQILSLLDRTERLHAYLAAQPDITVLTRISEHFPQRLRLLGKHCPPALFCKGDLSILSMPCVALAGSRAIHPTNRAFAARVGRMAAAEGYALVAGNAAGADAAAQEACLLSGGCVIAVLPDALTQVRAHENVLYCCDEGYDCTFSAARALRRNHIIHALGEKSFIAQCAAGKGGSWSGASQCLRRTGAEVYVFDDGSDGAQALLALGATGVGRNLRCLRALRPKQLSIFDENSPNSSFRQI